MADGKAPSERLQTMLAVETIEYLRALAATGLYGTSIPAVGRALIEQGVRDAIEKGFIKAKAK